MRLVMATELPSILTIEEISRYLRVNPSTAYRMANAGKIPGAFRVGHRWMFHRDDVDEWLLVAGTLMMRPKELKR
jgi:excisionase family DNA binding protein